MGRCTQVGVVKYGFTVFTVGNLYHDTILGNLLVR